MSCRKYKGLHEVIQKLTVREPAQFADKLDVQFCRQQCCVESQHNLLTDLMCRIIDKQCCLRIQHNGLTDLISTVL